MTDANYMSHTVVRCASVTAAVLNLFLSIAPVVNFFLAVYHNASNNIAASTRQTPDLSPLPVHITRLFGPVECWGCLKYSKYSEEGVEHLIGSESSLTSLALTLSYDIPFHYYSFKAVQ